jgi:Histidine kinase
MLRTCFSTVPSVIHSRLAMVTGSWGEPGAEGTAPLLGLRWQSSGSGPVNGYDAGLSATTAWSQGQGLASPVTSPIMVEGRLWGVAAAFSDTDPAPGGPATRMLGFTELVAMAIANSDSQAKLIASRARVVAAADRTRRRIERDLHDGAQQRLISLALQLRTRPVRHTARAAGWPSRWHGPPAGWPRWPGSCVRCHGAFTRSSWRRGAWGPPCAPWRAAPGCAPNSA